MEEIKFICLVWLQEHSMSWLNIQNAPLNNCQAKMNVFHFQLDDDNVTIDVSSLGAKSDQHKIPTKCNKFANLFTAFMLKLFELISELYWG